MNCKHATLLPSLLALLVASSAHAVVQSNTDFGTLSLGGDVELNLNAANTNPGTLLADSRQKDRWDMDGRVLLNVGALKAGDARTVEDDIKAVVHAASPGGKGKTVVKVIIETCFLSDEEKRTACELARKAGAHFVKTSTGFGTGGATADDVRLMRKAVGDALKVKASGGIRSYHDAIAMLDAGADRIGTSSGVAIVAELPE